MYKKIGLRKICIDKKGLSENNIFGKKLKQAGAELCQAQVQLG